jgi:hypothetical protein
VNFSDFLTFVGSARSSLAIKSPVFVCLFVEGVRVCMCVCVCV